MPFDISKLNLDNLAKTDVLNLDLQNIQQPIAGLDLKSEAKELGVPNNLLNQASAHLSNVINGEICDSDCQLQKRRVDHLRQINMLETARTEVIPELLNDVEGKYFAITQEDDPYRAWKRNYRYSYTLNRSLSKF